MKYTINKKTGGPMYLTESDELKLNANCPDSEKSGEGPGSCGGSKGGEKKEVSGKPAEGTKKTGKTSGVSDKVNMYPQDLTTMNKKMKREYLKEVIAGKTFKQLREEQDLVGQQQQTAYKIATTSKDPGERQRADLALKNLGVHENMLMQAVDAVSFDSAWARKIVEEATGISWDKLPKDKKPKPDSDNFGL